MALHSSDTAHSEFSASPLQTNPQQGQRFSKHSRAGYALWPLIIL